MKAYIKKTLTLFAIVIALFCSACTVNFNNLDTDQTKIINGVAEKGVLTANVTIFAYSITGRTIAQGSGVIYKGNGLSYYALTNNHVVYEGFSYSVMDAYGEIWNAKLEGYDASYDLAVVSFRPQTEKEYYVPKINETDPSVGDVVISIGNPQGVMNAITFGTVSKYLAIEALDKDSMLDDEGSNVEFEVIKHNAPIDSGSSGGALLDQNYNICGINFASGRGENSQFISGYAVQPTKILEFLTAKGLN